MKNLTIIIVLCVAVAGCGRKVEPTAVGAISEANSNNKVVADSIRPTMPDEAQVIDIQSAKIDIALENVPEELRPATITVDQLENDMPLVLQSEKKRADDLQKQLDDERAGSWFDSILSWSGWGLVTGVGLALARILGMPGVGLLSDPIARLIGGRHIKTAEANAAAFESQAGMVMGVVKSSEIGREALRRLDALLESTGIDLNALTNGEASSVDEIFKAAAKEHAVAQGDDIDAVKRVLGSVRIGIESDKINKALGALARTGASINELGDAMPC